MGRDFCTEIYIYLYLNRIPEINVLRMPTFIAIVVLLSNDMYSTTRLQIPFRVQFRPLRWVWGVGECD